MSPLRNLTGDSIDDLREERDRLIEENMRLKSGDYDEEEQVEKTSHNPTLVKYLRSKIYHFERAVEKLEKERSMLSVRATMAEEQLKV